MNRETSPQTPLVKKRTLGRFLSNFASLFYRSKKRGPEETLDEIEIEKQEKIVRIAELQKNIESLSAHIESVRVQMDDAATIAKQSSASEQSTPDLTIRRAFERKRWQFQEKRRLFEREDWEIIESLRRSNTEIHALRLDLLGLLLREVAIEESIPRNASLVNAPVVDVPLKEVATAETLVGTKDIAIAKKHIRSRDLLMLALRTFRVKLGMTLLTVLGIGVSFATIFFLVSLGYGFEKLLLDQFASETLVRSLTVQSPNPEVILLDRAVADRIAAMPGVEHVEPIFGLSGQIESDALAAEVELRGTDPEYFALSGGSIKEGRIFELGEHAIVLSSNFLQTMNKKSLDEFTKPLTITAFRSRPESDGAAESVEAINLGNDFRVVGINDDDDSSNVFLSPEFISPLVLQYNALNVLAENEKVVSELRVTIADQGFMSSSIVDTVDQATKVFNVAEIILALFGAASLVVATIGMVNTMTVSLLERTQEIGIMKVLGVADRDVRRLFLLEASIIGGLGGLSGIIMGILFSQGFNFFINFLASNLGGNSVSLFYYPPWFVFSIVISALIIGFLTGLLPSQRAAKMDPLNAVKYK